MADIKAESVLEAKVAVATVDCVCFGGNGGRIDPSPKWRPKIQIR